MKISMRLTPAVGAPGMELRQASLPALGAVPAALTPSRPLQSRLLALELADELFTRSKAFRGMLAPRFSAFLDRTLGFRPEKLLPPPAAAAAALRARTLEVIERWEEAYAAFYPQVGLEPQDLAIPACLSNLVPCGVYVGRHSVFLMATSLVLLSRSTIEHVLVACLQGK